MNDIIEVERVPFLLYNSKNQTEQIIGTVHWVSDHCFNVTLFDMNTDVFYREYDPEIQRLRAIGIMTNKEE